MGRLDLPDPIRDEDIHPTKGTTVDYMTAAQINTLGNILGAAKLAQEHAKECSLARGVPHMRIASLSYLASGDVIVSSEYGYGLPVDGRTADRYTDAIRPDGSRLEVFAENGRNA